MNVEIFTRAADSLRQFRRAELKEFSEDFDQDPVEALYVDPLPSNGVLKTVLSGNTTFILGRKGTGKSTIFAKAQSNIRQAEKNLSIYVDVKALYEITSANEAPISDIESVKINRGLLHEHFIRKNFLSQILKEVIVELRKILTNQGFIDKFLGRNLKYEDALSNLDKLLNRVVSGKLSASEIPILEYISNDHKSGEGRKSSTGFSVEAGGSASPAGPEISGKFGLNDFDEIMSNSEVYQKYADAVLRSFPYHNIIDEIKAILDELQMGRLVVFFDDFSEINWVNQKLFVDVILSPLNNSSDEKVKLKVAAYPGRVYYGNIDPGKIDTIRLDFYEIYKSNDLQTMESRSIDYTERLLRTRFDEFGEEIEQYFDPSQDMSEYFRLIFECSFNVPRIIGYLLHYCFRDRISQGETITAPSIKLAARKYYEDVLVPYFDRKNRFVLEPFERKLDRHNQQILLKDLISEAKDVRRKISTGEVGGGYFHTITNPPVSHFSILPRMEKLLSSLEMNFIVTKYHEMRDKDGNDVTIFALNYGLCETERLPWGYPRQRRDDRSYFVQRCFYYAALIHQFLAKTQTIRCDNCSASFSIDKKDSLEMYQWKCPECLVGTCRIIHLAAEYIDELKRFADEASLEEVEYDILQILSEEKKSMRAGEIGNLVDATYQLVGKRTSKLNEKGLVEKSREDGIVKSKITRRGRDLYFPEQT